MKLATLCGDHFLAKSFGVTNCDHVAGLLLAATLRDGDPLGAALKREARSHRIIRPTEPSAGSNSTPAPRTYTTPPPGVARATDSDDRWTVSGTQSGVTWAAEQGPGDIMLRGPMTGPLLAALRRRRFAKTGITVVGDAAVWAGLVGRYSVRVEPKPFHVTHEDHGDNQRIRCGAPTSGYADAVTLRVRNR